MIAHSGGIPQQSLPPNLGLVDVLPSAINEEVKVDGWQEAIGEVLTWLAAGGASQGSLRLRTYQLHRLAASVSCGPWDVRLADLLKFLANHSWSAETRRSHRSAVVLFCRYGRLAGYMSEDFAGLLPSVKTPPPQPRPAPESAIVRALAFTDSPRDRLMVLFGAYLGLRRAEIAQVHTRDLDGDMLYVRGKGGRVRRLPLPPELLEAFAGRDGYLFPGKCDGHLSPDRVGRILKGLLGQYHGHQLRHRFSSVAHARGADLLTLTRLCGWSNTNTAQTYTATPDGAIRAAVLSASS